MIKPDLIIRTNRRSLSITVNKAGNVVVHAPKRLSMDYIMAFVRDKEKWIDRKLKELEQVKNINNNIIEYKSFLFCGKEYKRLDLAGIKKIEITSGNFVVPASINKDKLNEMIQKWYTDISKDVITKRVEYFADLMHLNYLKLSYMNNKTRWGSCDKNGAIKLNFRLLMLPHRVIDYVIVHELSHLIEFNHSSRFYKIIESVMSDYKKQKKELQSYGYLLELYR